MENQHFQWVNPLFLWSCSIAMLNYQRINCNMSLTWNRVIERETSPYQLSFQWRCIIGSHPGPINLQLQSPQGFLGSEKSNGFWKWDAKKKMMGSHVMFHLEFTIVVVKSPTVRHTQIMLVGSLFPLYPIISRYISLHPTVSPLPRGNLR